MNNSEFFNANYSKERDSWLKADGGWEKNWWNDMPSNWGETPSWNSDGGSGSLNASAPYILQIVNACSSAISNVDIGDAYVNRINSNALWNFGNNSNITITSTVSGVSYLEFLAQSESKPFTVGKTMIISTSSGQLDQTVAITHRNASGDRNDHIITPTIDPFQNQTDRVIDTYEYLFDGMTRMRFNQINGSATVSVRLYSKNMFSATQVIAGRQAIQGYQAPNFVTPALANLLP